MEAPRVDVRAWSSPIPGVREVFHAGFAEHAYPPHAHATWTLFIVDAGAIRYDIAGRPNVAEPSMVSILPPHIVHDGRPADGRGYRKRVIYLDPDVVGEELIGAAVDRPRVGGPSMRRRVSNLHHALLCVDDELEAETRLAFVAEQIRAKLGAPQRALAPAHANDVAERLRAILDEHIGEPVRLATAAENIGVSPTQATRAFVRAFGIPPHAYLLARRLELARQRILAGDALATAAVAAGFYDQAHLTRHFTRHLGITPGRFASAASTPTRH